MHPQVHVACLLVTLSGYRSDSAGEFEQLVASLSPHTHDADYEAAFRKGRELIEEVRVEGVGWGVDPERRNVCYTDPGRAP
jgi:hypothetical protein